MVAKLVLRGVVRSVSASDSSLALFVLFHCHLVHAELVCLHTSVGAGLVLGLFFPLICRTTAREGGLTAMKQEQQLSWGAATPGQGLPLNGLLHPEPKGNTALAPALEGALKAQETDSPQEVRGDELHPVPMNTLQTPLSPRTSHKHTTHSRHRLCSEMGKSFPDKPHGQQYTATGNCIFRLVHVFWVTN